MGLLSGLVGLPLAPVRGVVWVARRVEDAAEQEMYDPAVIRAELAALLKDLEDGVIDEATYDEREEELLDRWEHNAADRAPTDGSTWTASELP
ncbi:MAG TPA: gas vesicle protein GvpG [Yinghuangia sp.]|uniref:gas vesicle protein GvpG n=1 Tax=Yinghuangia sp. YIM S10712 TaxID=3436930 RepID=UPI002B71360D|nr:gas vesicle protein GvpG [Yinghuangia sp.]